MLTGYAHFLPCLLLIMSVFADAGDAPAGGSAEASRFLGLAGSVAAVLNTPTGFYAAGTLASAGGRPVSNIAVWDGTNWHDLAGGVDGPVTSLCADGSLLYAAGAFTHAGGHPAQGIAAWDGSGWSALGPGLVGTVSGLAAVEGAVYAIGNLQTGEGVGFDGIACWNGTAWSELGDDANGPVAALAAYNGSLYAGGSFTSIGGINAIGIARWSGTAWFPLEAGLHVLEYNQVNGTTSILAVYDGLLIVGGVFDFAGGAKDPESALYINGATSSNIAAWDGGHWISLGTGLGQVQLGPRSYRGALMALLSNAQAIYGYYRPGDGNTRSFPQMDRTPRWAHWTNSEWVDVSLTGIDPSSLLKLGILTKIQIIANMPSSLQGSYGQELTFLANVTGGASGNPIVFTSSDPTTVAIEGHTVRLLKVGEALVTATQAGSDVLPSAEPVVCRIVVSPAPLTLTAYPALRRVGALGTFTGDIQGAVNDDLLSVILCTASDASTPAGIYPANSFFFLGITPQLVDPAGRAGNYSINAQGATLTLVDVLPRPVGTIPASATVGSLGGTLAITGQGMLEGMTVLWNGAPRMTTLVSATLARIQVLPEDLQTPGEAALTLRYADVTSESLVLPLVQAQPAPGPAGPPGPVGSAGPSGPAGVPGATVRTGPSAPDDTLGQDGDCYLAADDAQLYQRIDGTYRPVVALRGPTGPAGPVGPRGAVGPRGSIGLVGPAGPRGLPGLVGAAGPVGLTGPPGPAGAATGALATGAVPIVLDRGQDMLVTDPRIRAGSRIFLSLYDSSSGRWHPDGAVILSLRSVANGRFVIHVEAKRHNCTVDDRIFYISVDP